MSSQIFTKPLPYIALILAHLIWGANFVVAKFTLTEFPPMTLALLRFSLASLFLSPFLIAETKKAHIKPVHLPKLILIGILMITLNISLFFEVLQKTTAINASILTLIIPILSVFIGWTVLKEKIYLYNLGGITLGLIGALIIIGLKNFLGEAITSSELLGNIMIILAACVWVLGAILSKQMLKIYSTLIVTGVAFLVGTVTFIVPAAN